MASKKKLPISIFELVWYIICALVIIWGLVYVILSAIDKYNDLDGLHKFAGDFKTTFGLSLYFWGLIIIGIGIVAGVTVMIIYAKTFYKAADREQRRSARLSAAFKKESPVVDEQKAEVVEERKKRKLLANQRLLLKPKLQTNQKLQVKLLLKLKHLIKNLTQTKHLKPKKLKKKNHNRVIQKIKGLEALFSYCVLSFIRFSSFNRRAFIKLSFVYVHLLFRFF